jgi:hypothetical protein
MQKELGKACGVQGDKRKRVCHLVLKFKFVLASEMMKEKAVVMSPIAKCSCLTKVEMAMVKSRKVIAKEAHESKKVAKLGFPKSF